MTVTDSPTGSSVALGAPTFKPPQPKFGGLSQVSTDSWVPWTGGKPSTDWKGLIEPNPAVVGPNQYRPCSPSSKAKSQAYRIKGMDTKYSRDSDLHTLEKKLMKHFVAYGLDTITYLQDPSDPTKLVSVVENHGLFSLSSGSSAADLIYTTVYDTYDKENDSDAKEFLLNSVSPELEKQLYENCTTTDSFITYWLNLISIVKSVSIERYDAIKDRIKSRKMSDYSGENVESISTDFLDDWQELHSAKLYDNNLTMNMLKTIMSAGGENNEDFRFPLRSLKEKLDTVLLNVRHKTYQDAHAELVKQGVDVQAVLKKAKKVYRDLHDSGKWPASAHAKDSKAMNKNYGNVNHATSPEVKEFRTLINALVQSMGDQHGKKPAGKGKFGKNNRRNDRSVQSQTTTPRTSLSETIPARSKANVTMIALHHPRVGKPRSSSLATRRSVGVPSVIAGLTPMEPVITRPRKSFNGSDRLMLE